MGVRSCNLVGDNYSGKTKTLRQVLASYSKSLDAARLSKEHLQKETCNYSGMIDHL